MNRGEVRSMTKPQVSVIVPVYRTEAYLRRCVDSLRRQTLQELQIILVDDGSPDGCPELCDQLAREDRRILALHQENRGLGMSRNLGLKWAEGDYIAFVDSDDYILPEMLERLYEAACRHGADMVLSGLRYLGGAVFDQADGEEIKNVFSQEEVFRGANGIKKLMLGIVGATPEEREDSRYGFSACKNLYRRELLQQGGVRFQSEREICSEDVLFLLDVLLLGAKTVGIPGAWYCYCRNGSSLSKSRREGLFAQQKKLVQALKLRISQRAPEQEYQIYLDRQFQAMARVTAIQEAIYAREQGLSRHEAGKLLKQICGDSDLQETLKRYPYWRLPAMQAAFAFAMRWRLVGLQQVLVALRERL